MGCGGAPLPVGDEWERASDDGKPVGEDRQPPIEA